MAGLPGSGLGGLFYILLLLWMFIRQACAGDLTRERCRQMIPIAYMSIAMVAVLAMMAWLVARSFGPLPTFASIMAPSGNTGGWALIFGMTPVISIGVLLCALRVARLAVPRSGA
jgi:hypothetical protein